MVNPVILHLNTQNGDRLITIEPVYEEITGGDLFATGRYMLNEGGLALGEIRFDGDLFECEWTGNTIVEDENVYQIVKFITEYNEPELAVYLD